MKQKKCFYKDSKIVRNINIHRDFLDMLLKEKKLSTLGDTLLFFYLRLFAQCNMAHSRTNSYQTRYAEAGEFMTNDHELMELLGLKSKKRMYEILDKMSSLNLIVYGKEIVGKHRTVEIFIHVFKAAEYKSTKIYGTPKHGYFLADRELLSTLIPEDGKTKFSDMDIFLSLWTHTVYNDEYVPVSSMLPVVVYDGEEYIPMYTCRSMRKYFNCSSARVNRVIRLFVQLGLIKNFHYSHAGDVISPVDFSHYMFGETITVDDLDGMLKMYEIMGHRGQLDVGNFHIQEQSKEDRAEEILEDTILPKEDIEDNPFDDGIEEPGVLDDIELCQESDTLEGFERWQEDDVYQEIKDEKNRVECSEEDILVTSGRSEPVMDLDAVSKSDNLCFELDAFYSKVFEQQVEHYEEQAKVYQQCEEPYNNSIQNEQRMFDNIKGSEAYKDENMGTQGERWGLEATSPSLEEMECFYRENTCLDEEWYQGYEESGTDNVCESPEHCKSLVGYEKDDSTGEMEEQNIYANLCGSCPTKVEMDAFFKEQDEYDRAVNRTREINKAQGVIVSGQETDNMTSGILGKTGKEEAEESNNWHQKDGNQKYYSTTALIVEKKSKNKCIRHIIVDPEIIDRVGRCFEVEFGFALNLVGDISKNNDEENPVNSTNQGRNPPI